jgi:hypothetical protein
MVLNSTVKRRWLGAVLLLAALGMLIAGQTFLKTRLTEMAFLLYWLVCFLFTSAAILVAYIDARAVQIKTRYEARKLLETTLNNIQTDAKQRPPRTLSPTNDDHKPRR